MPTSQSSKRSATRPARPERRFRDLVPVLLGGFSLAAPVLVLNHYGLFAGTPVGRYLGHEVECVEVVMFCSALAALAMKLWQQGREGRAGRQTLLPPWDGQVRPVTEAAGLLAGLERLPARLQSTILVRRVASILDFLAQRGSAAELDDHLRALADNDALALETSYALVRFITWAIPILGFLGTVLGITQAITGVTPEVLENSLSTVTDGLALAFDATALALALTMLTMFLCFVVERLEQGALEQVDRFVDRQLAHRFERADSVGGEVMQVVRHNTEVVLEGLQRLVQQQAELWARTLAEVGQRRDTEEQRQQERFAGALEAVLERTLRGHAQQAAALQQHTVEKSAQVLAQLNTLASTVQNTGREQQAALERVASGVAAQLKALAQLQAGARELLRLEEALERNLAALAGSGAFEQTLHSLTAAIHLLTARAQAEPRLKLLESRQGPSAAA